VLAVVALVVGGVMAASWFVQPEAVQPPSPAPAPVPTTVEPPPPGPAVAPEPVAEPAVPVPVPAPAPVAVPSPQPSEPPPRAPAPVEPVPRGPRVKVTGADSAVFVGDDGARHSPPDVPSGSWLVRASFGGAEVPAGRVEIPASGEVSVHCEAVMRRCTVR
jgi:outer membrane biosynthesis protein TonB